jgi:hypothetical protein
VLLTTAKIVSRPDHHLQTGTSMKLSSDSLKLSGSLPSAIVSSLTSLPVP